MSVFCTNICTSTQDNKRWKLYGNYFSKRCTYQLLKLMEFFSYTPSRLDICIISMHFFRYVLWPEQRCNQRGWHLKFFQLSSTISQERYWHFIQNPNIDGKHSRYIHFNRVLTRHYIGPQENFRHPSRIRAPTAALHLSVLENSYRRRVSRVTENHPV